MRLVILESPYAGDVHKNLQYARAAVRDSISRGEAPIASHLLYTQPGILKDDVEEERQWGIDAGLAWRHVSEATVVYTDLGISKGMQYGIDASKAAGKPVEYRFLEEWKDRMDASVRKKLIRGIRLSEKPMGLRSTMEGLKYIGDVDQPTHEQGGFHDQAILTARSALLHIKKLRQELKAMRKT